MAIGPNFLWEVIFTDRQTEVESRAGISCCHPETLLSSNCAKDRVLAKLNNGEDAKNNITPIITGKPNLHQM